MKKILTMIVVSLLCVLTFPMLVQNATATAIDISAQYSSFVSAHNNYKQIFGQDVAIGQTVERTLSGVIDDPQPHYEWRSWSGQTYPGMDGFSIRIETIQSDYVYKLIGMGYMAGGQPSASGWVQVNSPYKIEQTNYALNAEWGGGSYDHINVDKLTGRIDFSAQWTNWPALIDAPAFEFAVTISKPGGTLPPFSYDTTRTLAAHAYDIDAKRVLMFGGYTHRTNILNPDLWTFDPASSQWALVSAGSGASARCAASMSYDPVAKRFLVFGGYTSSGEAGDTWAFQFSGSNAGAWTQILGAGPSARGFSPMVYDSKSKLFVLFGGGQYVYSLGDTWLFNPSTNAWLNANPSPSPPQRLQPAMAYDERTGKVLLFGGLNKAAGYLLSDTWLYDAATNGWQQVSTSTAPSARQCPSLSCDDNGVFYLFGGWRVDASGGLGQYLADTWKFDMATMQWTQLSPSTSPQAQSQGALLCISGSKFVLINGWRDSPLGEMWVYDDNENRWATVISQSDFEILVSPNLQIASPRSTTNFVVTAKSINGFSGEVQLDALNLGSELTAKFDSSTIIVPESGSAFTTMKISALSTYLANYDIIVKGTSGQKTRIASVKLKVPFMSVPYLSQGDTGWCGPTSLAMIMRFYGISVHQWEVANGLSVDHNGVIWQWALFKSYIESKGLGFDPVWIGVTKDTLLDMLSRGEPILLRVSILHFVVVTGYDANSDSFFINDPSGALILYMSLPETYAMPYSQVPVPWSQLQPFITYAVGIQGTPKVSLGVMNLIGGDSTYFRSVCASHKTNQPWSDNVYIWWSGSSTPSTNGLCWQNSNDHFCGLDPDDYLSIYGTPGGIGGLQALIVNPTDTSRDYQFEISFEKSGVQKWTSGKLAIPNVPACSMTNPPYSHTSPFEIRKILGEYGQYTIRLRLFDSYSILLDEIELPKIGYTPAAKVTVHSPANLFITDPLNHSVGTSPYTGEEVNDIPGAFYSGLGSEPQIVMIPEPINDVYSIILVGTATGDYTLTLEYITSEKTALQTLTGTITEEEEQYYSAQLFEPGEMTAISWEYVFKDPKRGTMLKMSADDKYFQFIAPSKDFGIKHDSKMKVLTHTIIICYQDRQMYLLATAVDDRIDFCTATAYDKQTRKFYLLIDKPNC